MEKALANLMLTPDSFFPFFRGSFFLENLKKRKENGKCLKRTMQKVLHFLRVSWKRP